MTFSICVREGTDPVRFGVAVTTNNPGIGVFCPFVSESGAVATQHRTHGTVGPQVLAAFDDGVAAVDAVPAAVEAADHGDELQIHALCAETRAVHTGDVTSVAGDTAGAGYSVAGNSLRTRDTLTATARAYRDADSDRPLAARLIDAIAAGDAAGGDKRQTDARSAAVRVVDPAAPVANEYYNDLRVDADPAPIDRLREQYELARAYHEESILGSDCD